jgi:hypothetical protein
MILGVSMVFIGCYGDEEFILGWQVLVDIFDRISCEGCLVFKYSAAAAAAEVVNEHSTHFMRKVHL